MRVFIECKTSGLPLSRSSLRKSVGMKLGGRSYSWYLFEGDQKQTAESRNISEDTDRVQLSREKQLPDGPCF